MSFPGFAAGREALGEVEIAYEVGGSGPPLLLLHGYPQTHFMWHAVAPALAEHFTVVAADMRGYGDSSAPPAGEDHAGYSFRAMARDQVELMRALGFESFGAAGHDRGARVVHRMALDHPDAVERAALLDILPTRTAFAHTNKAFATHTYHWFFLIQPDGLPEHMIGCDPGYYLREKLRRWSADGFAFSPDAVAEYERCFSRPEVIHATCEDYRAGASIDLEHDEADIDRPLECPLLVLWGGRGRLPKVLGNLVEVWSERALDVRGSELDSGHFLAEERPEETARELIAFFSG